MTQFENEELEFDHEDFLKIGWRNSLEPLDTFGWEQLTNSLSFEERVQSKLREKNYRVRKWT